ncbi:MAG: MazG nucleotide pyrophosphohydrolase domain-containing protein, partial [Clostridia bacterium]|nr:MazG nucleotide pyrophosphohydrolase domain-containing protein [Clostridia bacterium]
MIEGFEFKPRYTFGDLVAIMTLLRGENGCPWDREQTHESIRKNLIEETYEVVEAIDNKDRALLREELGDVLLQVVFHAEMERQAGGFDIEDVSDGICRKLIERHPHIFG